MEKNCFVDVHCHLDYYSDLKDVIKNAENEDAKIIVSQGVNVSSNRKTIELIKKYKIARAALGLYPIDALKMTDAEIDEEVEFIRENNSLIAAIGEVGLDFKECKNMNEQERQRRIFLKFINLARELGKPIIVHSRKAEIECIEMLEEAKSEKVVMHCFCGKISLAKRVADNGWMLSIPSSIKNNSQFQNMAEKIDINNILCETDSPFLHPDKKWPNEPCFVVESYIKIAELKKMSLEEAKARIYENFRRIFLRH